MWEKRGKEGRQRHKICNNNAKNKYQKYTRTHTHTHTQQYPHGLLE